MGRSLLWRIKVQTPDEVARHLRRLHQELKAQSPYQIFDLWEGCGRELVQQTFYKLVKAHHPDSYGGNLSDEIKRLAQENFLMVKDAYAKLRMAEGEQTVAQRPSSEQDLRISSSHLPGLDRELSGPISMPPRSGAEPTTSTTRTPTRQPMTTAPMHALNQERPTTSPVQAPIQAPVQVAARTIEPSARPTMTTAPIISRPESDGEELDERAQALERLRASTRRPLHAYGIDSPMSDAIEALAERSNPRISAPTPQASPAQDRKALLEQIANKRPTPPPVQNPQQPSRSHMATPSPVRAGSIPPADEAKEAFNEGYQEYKLKRLNKALPLFKKALELDPENGLYMTFYGQTLFKEHPEQRDKAEKLLRDAVITKHRQALPDAHLFLGLLLKTKPGGGDEAIRHFRNALYLNPASHEAEREIRLWERRQEEAANPTDAAGLLKKLFKK